MADQYGIELGNVLSNVENIRGARIRNTLAENELDRQQRMEAERTNALQGVSAPTAGLAAIDPSQATQLQSYIDGLSDDQRETARALNEEVGKAAAFILSSDDPEAAYQQVRGSTSPEIREAMPATFNQDWVEFQLAQAQSVSEILDRAQGSTSDATPRTDLGKAQADLNAGLITQEQYDQLVAAESGDGGRGTESADTNAIYRQAAGYFGGTFDVNGDLIGLDPTTARKVQDVAARASEIWQQNNELSHAQAVRFALQELDLWDPQQATDDGLGGGGDGGVIDFTEFFGVPE